MKQGHELRRFDVLIGNDGNRWKSLGATRCGTWNQFIPDDGDAWKTARPAQSLHTSQKPAFTPKRPQGTDRDQWLKREFSSLTLDPVDRADLVRRGFTADQIQQMGAVTFWKGRGYVIPIRDWDGLLTGAQIRLRESSTGGRYRWSHRDLQLSGGEMPLQILKGHAAKPAYWIEGTGAKPFKVHFETSSTVIGAAGGNFGSSADQVRTLLSQTKGQDQILLADAVSVLNPSVMNQYRRLADLIPDLQIQWWDQLEKCDGDADENSSWSDGIRLTSTEFFSDEFKAAVEQKLELRKQLTFKRKPDQVTTGDFLPAGTIPNDQGTVALRAPMGSGKTAQIIEHMDASDVPTHFIAHRRNLGKNFNARRRDPLTPYIEEGQGFTADGYDVDLSTVTGSITCLDSCHPFSSLRRKADDFNGTNIYLDETDQGFVHLLNSTTCKKERPKILSTIHEGFQVANQVIAASGTMDDISLELLESIRGERAFVIDHQRDGDIFSYDFIQNETAALGQLVSAAKDGKRLLIACSDAGSEIKANPIGATNLLAYLRQYCPHLDNTNSCAFTAPTITTGDKGSREKQFMKDPVGAVQGLQVAIFSPVAETGVDINLKGYFDEMFVLSSGYTQSPQSLVQAACRLRDPDVSRHFLAPLSAPKHSAHGVTNWQELVMEVTGNAAFNHSLIDLGPLLTHSIRNRIPALDCPFLRAWAKYKIREDLMSTHYRFAVSELLQQLGAKRNLASVVLKRDETIAKAARNFNKEQKQPAAEAVIDATLPNTPQFEVATPQQKTAGRRRQKLEVQTGQKFTAETTSIEQVIQTEKALKPLKMRLLLSNPKLLSQCHQQQLQDLTSWEPDDGKFSTSQRVQALVLMGAVDLLKAGQQLNGKDPRVIALNEFRTKQAGLLSRIFDTKITAYKDSMRAVNWIAAMVGLKTQQISEDRENGRTYVLTEAFDAVEVGKILAHWQENPASTIGGNGIKPIPMSQKSLNKKEKSRKFCDTDAPDSTVPTCGDIKLASSI